MKKAIIHRYDNKPDIVAVEKNGCSEVYKAAKDNNFELVIVIPTGKAKTDFAVYADATSGQHIPDESKPWPGKPDRYAYRVNVENVRQTNLLKVRKAIEAGGNIYAGAWTVRVVTVDESLL